VKHETESSERGNPGLSVSKRSVLRVAWVATVIVAINLPPSGYAANMSGSARRSKPEHHKGGHKDQNHKYRIAKSMHVQQRRIEEICSGTLAISADTALRLERLFGMSAQAWLNLQSQYDLEVAARDLRQRIDAEVLRSLQRRPRFPADGIETQPLHRLTRGHRREVSLYRHRRRDRRAGALAADVHIGKMPPRFRTLELAQAAGDQLMAEQRNK